MKNVLVIALLFVASSNLVQAQVVGGTFDKLLDLYAMERYEDCAWKAQKLTENDKYRKEAEPYLYMSMCMLQIHLAKDDYDPEMYKDPLKDAMKYAAKFRKKDKEGVMYSDNTDFFDDLKKESLIEGRFLFKDKQFRKAASLYKRVVKFIPEDNNILYMAGVSNILARNAGEGTLMINQAKEKFSAAEGEYEWDAESSEDFVDCVIAYSDFLAAEAKTSEAKEAVTFAQGLIKDNVKLRNQSVKLGS